MVIPMTLQVKIILFSFISGILTGTLFDLYRVFRGVNKYKIITAIEDLLFWVLCSLVVFIFLLYTNQAFISLYVYLCIIIGILFYMKVFSKTFIRGQYYTIGKSRKGVRVAFKHFSYPIKYLFYKKGEKNKTNNKKISWIK